MASFKDRLRRAPTQFTRIMQNAQRSGLVQVNTHAENAEMRWRQTLQGAQTG